MENGRDLLLTKENVHGPHRWPRSPRYGEILLSSNSALRIDRIKAASDQLKGKLRTTFKASSPRAEGHSQRRVTFQTPPTNRAPSETHPALRQRERPRSGPAVDVTAPDHQIAVHGGTTSTIECLPHRLRISKGQRTSGPQQRIEELVRDVGHLNQELSYYKDTRKVLMKLFDSVKASHEALRVAMAEADRESPLVPSSFHVLILQAGT